MQEQNLEGLLKPIMSKWDQRMKPEWMAKPLLYMRTVANRGADDTVKSLTAALYTPQLLSSTTDHPLPSVHNCPCGNGLNAMRALVAQSEPGLAA